MASPLTSFTKHKYTSIFFIFAATEASIQPHMGPEDLKGTSEEEEDSLSFLSTFVRRVIKPENENNLTN